MPTGACTRCNDLDMHYLTFVRALLKSLYSCRSAHISVAPDLPPIKSPLSPLKKPAFPFFVPIARQNSAYSSISIAFRPHDRVTAYPSLNFQARGPDHPPIYNPAHIHPSFPAAVKPSLMFSSHKRGNRRRRKRRAIRRPKPRLSRRPKHQQKRQPKSPPKGQLKRQHKCRPKSRTKSQLKGEPKSQHERQLKNQLESQHKSQFKRQPKSQTKPRPKPHQMSHHESYYPLGNQEAYPLGRHEPYYEPQIDERHPKQYYGSRADDDPVSIMIRGNPHSSPPGRNGCCSRRLLRDCIRITRAAQVGHQRFPSKSSLIILKASCQIIFVGVAFALATLSVLPSKNITYPPGGTGGHSELLFILAAGSLGIISSLFGFSSSFECYDCLNRMADNGDKRRVFRYTTVYIDVISVGIAAGAIAVSKAPVDLLFWTSPPFPLYL